MNLHIDMNLSRQEKEQKKTTRSKTNQASEIVLLLGGNTTQQHYLCNTEPVYTKFEPTRKRTFFGEQFLFFLQNYSLAKRTATALPSSWKKINQYITLQQNNLLLALYSNKQKITKTTTTIYLETDIRLCPILYKLTTTKNTPQFTQPETLET